MKFLTKITILVFMMALIITTMALGQTEKGTFILGGTAGFENTRYADDYTIQTINFNPNVSYFFLDKFSIGVLTPLTFRAFGENSENRSFRYEFGPVLRYYFTFNKMAVFPEVSYTVGKSREKVQIFNPVLGETEERIVNGVVKNLNVGAGFTYFINRNIGIEAILQYVNHDETFDELVSDLEFSEINLKIGFQIYLRNEKVD